MIALGLVAWPLEDFRIATGPLVFIGALLYVGGRP